MDDSPSLTQPRLMKAVELAPCDHEAKFRAVFEATPEGILITNDAGRYTDANAAACALLGMRRENIVGRSVEDFADPHRREEIRRSWRGFLEQGDQRGL